MPFFWRSLFARVQVLNPKSLQAARSQKCLNYWLFFKRPDLSTISCQKAQRNSLVAAVTRKQLLYCLRFVARSSFFSRKQDSDGFAESNQHSAVREETQPFGKPLKTGDQSCLSTSQCLAKHIPTANCPTNCGTEKEWGQNSCIFTAWVEAFCRSQLWHDLRDLCPSYCWEAFTHGVRLL